MNKTLLLSVFAFLCLSGNLDQALTERKVVNFSLGKPGTAAYEHFSFWAGGEGKPVIEYSYGKKPIEIKLDFLGTETFDGQKALKVQFPNGLTLFIVTDGSTLKVSDGDKYKKTFEWEYEGPIDGRGTFCLPCVDEDQSITFLKKNFFR